MSSGRPRSSIPEGVVLGSVAFLAVVVLLSLIVDGTFTNDEGHYTLTLLGLRDGTFRVEATRGLLPSMELLLPGMFASETPIAPVQPPLYAFIALPFSYLGWPALIALNVVSFVATGVVVHRLAARGSSDRGTPWIALGIYWLASFSVEYALGMWPHCLAVALVTSGLWSLLSARDRLMAGRWRVGLLLAILGGFLFGLATGTRYQEIAVAALVGAGVVLTLPWLRGRARLTATEGTVGNPPRPIGAAQTARAAAALALATAFGLAGPLAAMSVINHARIDTWNPVTKGPGYSELPPQLPSTENALGRSVSTRAPTLVTGFVHRVVDYSQKPPGRVSTGGRRVGTPIAYAGVPKKALLQSAPWMALPFLTLAGIWWPRRLRASPTSQTGAAEHPSHTQRRDGRVYMLVLFGVVALFSMAGADRTSGFCFNERYFLELMPIGAIVSAWALERLRASRPALVVGCLVGAALALASLLLSWRGQPAGVLYVPLGLALLVTFVSVASRRLPRGSAAILGAALGWAFLVHIGDDTRAMLELRASHGHYRDVLARHLDARPTALFAFWGNSTPFFPLQLHHPLILVDPFRDGGETARPLMDQLLADQRRILVLVDRMPDALLNHMLAGRLIRMIPEAELQIVEVLQPPAPTSPRTAP